MYKRDHYLVYSHSNCIVSLVFEVAISTGSSWNRFCKLCLPQCIRWWQCQCSNYRWSFGWKIVALDISLVFNFALNTWQCKSHDCLFVAEWFLSDTKSSFLFTNSIFLQTESKRLEKIVKIILESKIFWPISYLIKPIGSESSLEAKFWTLMPFSSMKSKFLSLCWFILTLMTSSEATFWQMSTIIRTEQVKTLFEINVSDNILMSE